MCAGRWEEAFGNYKGEWEYVLPSPFQDAGMRQQGFIRGLGQLEKLWGDFLLKMSLAMVDRL